MTYTQAFLENIDRGILEKLKKESGELISLKEFAKLSIGYHQTEVDINEFYFEENSNNELVEAIKNMKKILRKVINSKMKLNMMRYKFPLINTSITPLKKNII